MDHSLDQPIAYGRTAEIFAWKNGQILKLFYDWFSLDDIQYELQVAQALQVSGLPIPHVDGIIQVKGRYGLIYQRVEGVTMLELMLQKPWNGLRYAHKMAELHTRIHAISIHADIPLLTNKLTNKINQAKSLPESQRIEMREMLNSMPAGDRLCHGDFHPGNILVTKQGETIIDWIDAAIGSPMADVARSSVLMLGAAASGQLRKPLIRLFIRTLHSVYIRHYFSLQKSGKVEYLNWLPIVAAARLSENIPELEEWLLARSRKGTGR